MSMLAEPRRKQKVFNLRAKNSVWSNDSEKFGQKMLEKMGWSAGKGLGAKENGVVEHVLARYKNDSAGLGFEDRNDQWTKNEQDFEGLLKSLSGENNSDHNEIHKAISLEEKSKKSQARVHYHKFTRGKDVSKYSAKDLANILGKKTLSENPTVAKADVVTPAEEQSVVTGQLFTTKGTMLDYFKKFKTPGASVSIENIEGGVDNEQCVTFGFRGFAQNNADDTNIGFCNEDKADKILKKKKKRKREPTDQNSNSASLSFSDDFTPQENKDQICKYVGELIPRKKKKNKKDKTHCLLYFDTMNESTAVGIEMNTDDVPAIDASPQSKKRKKIKNIRIDSVQINNTILEDCDSTGISMNNSCSVKNKGKALLNPVDDCLLPNKVHGDDICTKAKSKRKKNKNNLDTTENHSTTEIEFGTLRKCSYEPLVIEQKLFKDCSQDSGYDLPQKSKKKKKKKNC